ERTAGISSEPSVWTVEGTAAVRYAPTAGATTWTDSGDEPGSRERSCQTTPGPVIDDSSGGGADLGLSHRPDAGNGAAFRAQQKRDQLRGTDSQRRSQWRAATAGWHQ